MGVKSSNGINRLMNIKVLKRGVSTAPPKLLTKKQSLLFKDFLNQEWDLSDYPETGLIPMPTYNFLSDLNYGNIRAFIYTAEKVDGKPYKSMAGSETGKIPQKGIAKLEKAGLVKIITNSNGEQIFTITKVGHQIIKLARSKEMYHLPLGVHPTQKSPVDEKDIYGNYFYKSSILNPLTNVYETVTTNYGYDTNGRLRRYSDGISSPKDDFILEFADVPYDKKKFGKTVCDISGKANLYDDKNTPIKSGNGYADRSGANRLRSYYSITNPSKIQLKPVAYGHQLFGDLYCLQGEHKGTPVNVEVSYKILNYFMGKYGTNLEVYIPGWNDYKGVPSGSIFFMKGGKLVGIALKSYKPSQAPDFKKLYVPNNELKQLIKNQLPNQA